MEQLAVGASADLIDDGWLEVEEDGTGDVLASTGLGEEGVVSVILDTDGLVGRHGAIGLNAMFKAVKLPACITDLATSLADVDRDRLTHGVFVENLEKSRVVKG